MTGRRNSDLMQELEAFRTALGVRATFSETEDGEITDYSVSDVKAGTYGPDSVSYRISSTNRSGAVYGIITLVVEGDVAMQAASVLVARPTEQTASSADSCRSSRTSEPALLAHRRPRRRRQVVQRCRTDAAFGEPNGRLCPAAVDLNGHRVAGLDQLLLELGFGEEFRATGAFEQPAVLGTPYDAAVGGAVLDELPCGRSRPPWFLRA
ncbi:hypothetical protein [Yinghuangia aomiensis]|uniref:hypothetical protein n=1 Tax=Yinghuangia aomiensis TaxID=676205 RepID=UPI0031E88ACC